MKAAIFIVCFTRDSGYTEARKTAIIPNYMLELHSYPLNLYLSLHRGGNGGDYSGCRWFTSWQTKTLSMTHFPMSSDSCTPVRDSMLCGWSVFMSGVVLTLSSS